VDDLLAAGVDARVEFDAERPTGTCIVLVDPTGERTMVPSAGANDATVDVAVLPREADWLYLSGYALLGAGSRPSAHAALRLARDRGWSIAVDAASAAPLTAVGADTFLDWLGPKAADVLLFANEDEAQVLTGRTDPIPAARVLAERVGQAVVKSGAAGAVWSDGKAVHATAALPATVIDSTGAGDAFAAGFLARSGDVDAKLAAAVGLAARAVVRVGGRPDTSIRT
jgi:ribokinase